MRRALLASLLLLVATTTTTTTYAQSNVCEAPATGAPITLEGNELTQTAPFSLEGGTYTFDWSVAPSRFTAVSMNLVSTDDDVGFGKLLVNTTTVTNGHTYVYNVKKGTYYLKISAHSKWTATLTPVAAS